MVSITTAVLYLAVLSAAPLLVCLAVFRRKCRAMAGVTYSYWRCLGYFFSGGDYESCPHFSGSSDDEVQARVNIHSLYLIFYLWDKPHYRNGTFHDDMTKNLRNVAIPGTGLPLSVVASSKAATFLYVWFVYPTIALFAALKVQHDAVGRRSEEEDVMVGAFREQLLCPKDWFSFWRLNCRLASYHALTTGETGYECEDKWTFLTRCEEAGIPISPCLKMPAMIVKHRNEEGGLGLHAFANATAGGDWIIQEALRNAHWLQEMLPKVAPLSTMRVITSSTGGLTSPLQLNGADAVSKADEEGMVSVCSCVLRAGREGAVTDHVSVLFDVDPITGIIKEGTSNAHWYALGAKAVFTTNWTSEKDITTHPDNDFKFVGKQIPNFEDALRLVRRAHLTLSPGVPMIGWDVAFTTIGTVLLEANYSCNFFRGTFDQPAYFRLVDRYMGNLEARRKPMAARKHEEQKDV